MLFALSAGAQSITASFDGATLASTDTVRAQASDDGLEFRPVFSNTTASDIVARIKVEKLDESDITVMSVCTGMLCMTGSQSAPFKLLAQSTYTDTHIDFIVPEDAGTGLFRVSVYDTAHPSTKAEFLLKVYSANTTIGISNVADEASFLAYPNPAHGAVAIDYSLNNSEGDIVLMNISGGIVRTVHVEGTEGSIRLNLSGLPAGVYLYALRDGKRMCGMKKIVVK